MEVTEFAAFAQREHNRLVRTLTLHCGDRPLAEQLAQDAFVRARERWDQVGRMDAPGAWLHRVAINLSNSWWRRQAAERRAYARIGSRLGPQQQPADHADVLTVRTALRALPSRQREVLVLRYFLDLSVGETATRMGAKDGYVKSLTHRAITALRAQLADTEITEVLHHA